MLLLSSVVVEKAGRVLFGPVSFSFGSAHVGLVGFSGVGKSCLAWVMAGVEEPLEGRVACDSRVEYFPQEEPRPEGVVGDFLGDLWCSEAPSDPLWYKLLPDVEPGAALASLSGGEWMRLRLLRLLSGEGRFIILDEPTNNLDFQSQDLLQSALSRFGGLLVVASHDESFVRDLSITDELFLTAARS